MTDPYAQMAKQILKPKKQDSESAGFCKVQIAAIMRGADSFEFNGERFPVESRHTSMHNLGLNRRWQE